MRVGIFGGSFNPPHIAHLAVAEVCAEAAGLDRVLWIPAATPPHKRDDPALASPEHRLAMVRLATAGNPLFDVSDIEIARAGVSYTIDTLRALRAERPTDELRLILGSDSLDAFLSWKAPEDILAIAPLVVYGRPGSVPGAELQSPFSERALLVEGPPLDLSSTLIRSRLMAGRTVRYLVPDSVQDYIKTNGLYSV